MPRFLIESHAADNSFAVQVIAPTRKDAFAKVTTLCKGCREDNPDERSYRCKMCGGEYCAVRVKKKRAKKRISEHRREVERWLDAHGYYEDRDGSVRSLPKPEASPC